MMEAFGYLAACCLPDALRVADFVRPTRNPLDKDHL